MVSWFHLVLNSTGPTKNEHVRDDIGSLRVELTEEHLKEISNAVPIEEVAGDRASESIMNFTNKLKREYFLRETHLRTNRQRAKS